MAPAPAMTPPPVMASPAASATLASVGTERCTNQGVCDAYDRAQAFGGTEEHEGEQARANGDLRVVHRLRGGTTGLVSCPGVASGRSPLIASDVVRNFTLTIDDSCIN
jgi:hypothetical protein